MGKAMTEIDVDGLPVKVNKDKYEADPDAVIEEVRAKRAEIVGDLTDLHEVPPDYDELVSIYGEEG